jgi:hypothetical protein
VIEKTALGREPSCCLQDSRTAAFGPARAVADDFVPPAQGGPGDISSNSRGSPCATSADSPSRPADTPDRKQSSADDNRSGVAFGTQPGCKLVVVDDKGAAERLADSSSNDDPPLGDSRREWKGFILSGSTLRPGRASQKNQHRGETSIEFSTASHADGPQTVFRLQWRQHDSSFNRDTCVRKTSSLCGVAPFTKSADLSARNRDKRLLSCATLRNNRLCITKLTLSKA